MDEKTIITNDIKEYKSQEELFAEWETLTAMLKKLQFVRGETDIEQTTALRKRMQIKMKLSMLRNKDFPVLSVIRDYSLCTEEQEFFMLTLIMTLSGDHFIEIGKVLRFFASNSNEVIEKTKFFAPSAKLMKDKIFLASEFMFGNKNYLETNIVINPKILNYILGIQATESKKPKSEEDTQTLFTIRNPRTDISSVVLSQSNKQQVEELINYIKNRKAINEKIQLSKTIEKGYGCILLFSGTPGTGKTLLAEGIAKELNKKLYVVNYSKMISKWVGNTEKHIEEMFRIAEKEEPVVLLDEADALLSRRVDGERHIDRSYNRELLLFLQKIEEFTGILIMTTNREVMLDDALNRRITSKINFDTPGANEREKIWRMLIPTNITIATDVNFSALATKFPFSGGYIKNAVLCGIIKAVSRSKEDITINMKDLLSASEAEYSKIHKEPTKRIGFYA
ncbi:MAG: ATP-binding protein [bacterium]